MGWSPLIGNVRKYTISVLEPRKKREFLLSMVFSLGNSAIYSGNLLFVSRFQGTGGVYPWAPALDKSEHQAICNVGHTSGGPKSSPLYLVMVTRRGGSFRGGLLFRFRGPLCECVCMCVCVRICECMCSY